MKVYCTVCFGRKPMSKMRAADTIALALLAADVVVPTAVEKQERNLLCPTCNTANTKALKEQEQEQEEDPPSASGSKAPYNRRSPAELFELVTSQGEQLKKAKAEIRSLKDAASILERRLKQPLLKAMDACIEAGLLCSERYELPHPVLTASAMGAKGLVLLVTIRHSRVLCFVQRAN
jgi:hypothetical protein